MLHRELFASSAKRQGPSPVRSMLEAEPHLGGDPDPVPPEARRLQLLDADAIQVELPLDERQLVSGASCPLKQRLGRSATFNSLGIQR